MSTIAASRSPTSSMKELPLAFCYDRFVVGMAGVPSGRSGEAPARYGPRTAGCARLHTFHAPPVRAWFAGWVGFGVPSTAGAMVGAQALIGQPWWRGRSRSTASHPRMPARPCRGWWRSWWRWPCWPLWRLRKTRSSCVLSALRRCVRPSVGLCARVCVCVCVCVTIIPTRRLH